MQKFFKGGFAKGKRTYITAILGILGAIGGFISGEMNFFETFGIVFPLLSVFFLRASQGV